MTRAIHRFLTDDHRRLDALLERAVADVQRFDHAAYAAFRGGLLRHIGLEEKILLPEAQRLRGGEPLAVAATLRLQHGAIAALLVPTPTPLIRHRRLDGCTIEDRRARTCRDDGDN